MQKATNDEKPDAQDKYNNSIDEYETIYTRNIKLMLQTITTTRYTSNKQLLSLQHGSSHVNKKYETNRANSSICQYGFTTMTSIRV